jgi:hypothetical protein
VCKSRSRNVLFSRPYDSPPGARTFNHAGLGAKREIWLTWLG